MRRAAAIAMTAALWLAVACANDGPPTHVERRSTLPVEEPNANRVEEAEQAVPTTDEPAESQAESDRLPPNHLIMRLTRELDVYQWIGDDWLPFRSFGPRTLLLADGWVEQGNGVIWLHLDLNGELDGWARLEQSPLSREEALSLPMLERPSLPSTVLNGPDARRSWGVYEIGIFDQHGALLQVFRGFGGLDCGQRTSSATWSPDGSRVVFGPRRLGCA